MGLMLDSTAVVAAERHGRNARQLLEEIALCVGDEEIAISAITVLELAHGIARADSPERREQRRRFLDKLLSAVPVEPVTVRIAVRAGQLDGENRARGVRIPPLTSQLASQRWSSAIELGQPTCVTSGALTTWRSFSCNWTSHLW